MGLLSRAGRRRLEVTAPELTSSGPAAGRGASAETLDEMGKALRERLGRLPIELSTPYTALSLLKAYGAFQAGFCLSLNDGNYSSYASVGFGIEKISIPQETVWSEAKARDRYFRLDSLKSSETKNTKKDFIYWVFPLDAPISSPKNTKEPWKAVMILGTLEPSGFNPEPVSAILEDVADKMVLPKNQKAAVSRETAPDFDSMEFLGYGESNADESTIESAIEEEIAQFYRIYLDFNCIVLANPVTASKRTFNEQLGFCEKVSSIVGRTGTVIALPSGHPLILLSVEVDRELIAHRLSKTLKTKTLLSFEAKNPENALIRISSLM